MKNSKFFADVICTWSLWRGEGESKGTRELSPSPLPSWGILEVRRAGARTHEGRQTVDANGCCRLQLGRTHCKSTCSSSRPTFRKMQPRKLGMRFLMARSLSVDHVTCARCAAMSSREDQKGVINLPFAFFRLSNATLLARLLTEETWEATFPACM